MIKNKKGYVMANWDLFQHEIDNYIKAERDWKATRFLYLRSLMERVLEISKIIKGGIVKPESCSEPLTIPYDLADFSVHDIIEEKYPASRYKIECDHVRIRISFYAVFRGENDTCYTFSFPILDDDYDEYIRELRNEMELSRKKIFASDLELKRKRIEKLQKELNALRDGQDKAIDEIESFTETM